MTSFNNTKQLVSYAKHNDASIGSYANLIANTGPPYYHGHQNEQNNMRIQNRTEK